MLTYDKRQMLAHQLQIGDIIEAFEVHWEIVEVKDGLEEGKVTFICKGAYGSDNRTEVSFTLPYGLGVVIILGRLT